MTDYNQDYEERGHHAAKVYLTDDKPEEYEEVTLIRDRQGILWPAWCRTAKWTKVPDPYKRPDPIYAETKTKGKRSGAPGFKQKPGALEEDDLLWFKAVRGENASRLPALKKPYTYLGEVGSEYAVQVPVTVLNMVYREAAQLARRVVTCKVTGRTIHTRHKEAESEDLAYRVDLQGDTWVGARLSKLVRTYKGGELLLVHRRKMPTMNWSGIVWGMSPET